MPNTRQPERRTYSYRAQVQGDANSNGIIEGNASQVGVMDAYNSVIMPGAFDGALQNFKKSGHVCFNHNWSKWIGMPKEARMDGRFLRVVGEFYDDPESQEIRNKLQARQERNLDTDFSITFWPDWDSTDFFESGEKLWIMATGMGYDMAQMDASIRDHKGYCWMIPRVLDIGEWGPVMAGATPGAGVTDVRSLNELRDGSLAGLSFENHLDHALAAVEGVLSRASGIAEKRANDDRTLGQSRIAQMDALAASIENLARACRSDDPAWRKLQMEADAMLAGL